MSDTLKAARPAPSSEVGSGGAQTEAPPDIPGLQLLSRQEDTSTAIVWRALQLSLDREVTLWIMKPDRVGRPGQVEHFEALARAVARIRHPNIVQVIDVMRLADGTPYVMLENMDGAMLASVLHMERTLDQMRALHIGSEIAKALDFAWKQCGFVHRNIKPETIFLGNGDTVKVTTFGSATLVKAGENPLAYDEGLFVGTPNYASPEQIECLRTIDFHSDMYSTGALLYRLVTGITPFGDETDPMAVFELQRSGTLENPRDLDPGIKPGVAHIIRKMMAKTPEDRYMWWQDAIEDMHRVLAGRPPFMDSGHSVPASSTIAPPGTAPASERPAVRSRQTAASKRTAGTGTGSASSPASEQAAPRSSGPGVLLRVLAIFLIVGFCFWLADRRIFDLEGGASEAVGETGVAPQTRGVIDEADPAADPGSAVSETGEWDDPETPEVEPQAPMEAPQPSAEPSGSVHTPPTQTTGAAVDTARPPQEALVESLYRSVVALPLPEARRRAQSLFKASVDVEGIDTEACKRIWGAFVETGSYEDLVGVSLAGTPGRRSLAVGGEQIDFSPRMYSNGELVGTLHLEDGTMKEGHRIQLSDMTPGEMYDCVFATTVDPSRPALLARAFLTMKMKERGAFSILLEKHNLKELEPFLDFVGK